MRWEVFNRKRNKRDIGMEYYNAYKDTKVRISPADRTDTADFQAVIS